ncbi:TIGR02680 family protein [Actinospica durhamensis]|uniref:TIGR02680 family protein n=1 Tax=Actinospica durhamensis TaxID=1508375 RepID=A0A941ELW2_9ACTN|nr:TIGR02680 family protein [Actinospica durhamensis]MBR7833273.1 TIGR02680 family protein [Actinospica durhamensis]
MTTRFKPTRAGIINLWNYVDEEFVFGDGRLALRGHNGSGKTKALEVLFPFILDGSLSSRRLDPFSGENRTMKSNLLYRGQDAEYGYVWMEFARDAEPAETVTLVIGMSAHKNRDDVSVSYYVTGQRLGIDFGLLSTDSRPLTAKQLAAKLGPLSCLKDSRANYRNAVDARLFGLGPERYAQLLDLLLSLRRPLLAKDLDPQKVSATLTAGLSPVDEELVEQAARDFDNLAAVQQRHKDLNDTKDAVDAFLAPYTAYLKTHTKWQLERIDARQSACAEIATSMHTAAREVARATDAEAAARRTASDARTRDGVLTARREVLTDSEAYKDYKTFLQRQKQLAELETTVAQDRARLAKDRHNTDALIRETDTLQQHTDVVAAGCTRNERDLLTSAQEAGLSDDAAGLDLAAEDLTTRVTALAAARRDDVRAVRDQLTLVAQAQRERAGADTRLGEERGKAERREAEHTDALTARQTATGELTTALQEWMTTWSEAGVATDALCAVLVQAVDRIGEPDQPGLEHVVRTATASRRDQLIAERERTRSAITGIDTEAKKAAADRAEIEAQRDEAPPETDLRTAERANRPGAPFWRLVRFRDHVTAEHAAALEGALYGSGTLTAWVHPDPAETGNALGRCESDAYLVPLPDAARPHWPSLADYLTAEEQDLVPAEVIHAILASIRVPDDTRGLEPGAPWVDTSARFGLGNQVGSRPKAAPEFIGATNREARRAARLAELDGLLTRLAERRTLSEGQLTSTNELIEDIDEALAKLPPTQPVIDAMAAVTTAAARLSDAEADVRKASKQLDAATSELSGQQRKLRHVAGERAMPATEAEVDVVFEAVGAMTQAAGKLVAGRAELGRLEKDLGSRRGRIAELEEDYRGNAEALAELEEKLLAERAAVKEAESSAGKGYEEIAAEVEGIDGELVTVRDKLHSAQSAASREHDSGVAAARDLENHRGALSRAFQELRESAEEFEPYAHPDLRAVLGVSLSEPWPPSTQWGSPDSSVEQVTTHFAGADEVVDASAAVRFTLPPTAVGILAACREAVRGGRALTQNSVDNANHALAAAYQDFERVLRNVEDGYEVNLGLGTPALVEVTAGDGRQPVARFAQRVAEEAHTQGILLEEREREVLEDSLLTALAQQIHHRVLAAKDLVKEMDADTRAKPMSSGISIGINWVRSDKATDQQTAVATQLQRSTTALGQDGLAQLRGRLREMIREHKAQHPRDTFRETLAAVLDYRGWYMFSIQLIQPGGAVEQLTRKRHSSMSGGEKSAAIHLPLFAAANAIYSSAHPTCPRMIALDEAFAGIDGNFTPELLGLTTRFDLDLFMTGHELWVTFPSVPMIAHYDMLHDRASQTVSALLILWDGQQLIDAAAGFGGNDAIAQELLGFAPSRREPVNMSTTTVPIDAAEDDEPDNGDES